MSTKKEEQFTQIPHSLMRNKELTDQDKLTLGIILSFINNDKECFIGNDRLGDMLGISKNAASKRILRLESLGCIKLNYTYKEGKKEVDKRYITLLSITPKVCPDRLQGIVPQTIGMSSEDRGYSPIDHTVYPDRIDGVCPKVGGIIQPFLLNNELNNLENKLLHNLSNKELNNKISIEQQIEQIVVELNLIKNDLTNDAGETRCKLEQKKYQLEKELTQLK